MITIDEQDIETLITLLESNTERFKIVNYIKEYIYNPDYEKEK